MGAFWVLFVWVGVMGWVWGAGALDCKVPNGLTIASPADVAALNKCTTVTARVTISASAPQDIQLNGPKSLATLQASSAKALRSISSSSLLSIDSIQLEGLSNLAALNFSALNNLDSVHLEDLPALENCSFGLGPRSVVNVINTGLENVDWLKWPVSTSLNISSNANLEGVSLPWETIQGAVAIAQNAALKKVDVFAVKDVPGNLTLEGDAQLKSLAWDKLESVKGSMLLSGAFTNVSMPALQKVDGELTIASTGDIDESCDTLKKMDIKGDYACTSRAQTPPSSANSPPSSQTPGSADPSSTPDPDETQDTSDMAMGAKIGIIIAAVILGLFLVVGAVCFFRARSRGKVREIVISAPIPIPPPAAPSAPSVAGSEASEAGSPRLESAELVGVGKRVDAGGVRVVLNGEEMREVDGDGGGGGAGGLGREASLRSVSSVGSGVALVRQDMRV